VWVFVVQLGDFVGVELGSIELEVCWYGLEVIDQVDGFEYWLCFCEG